MIVFSPVPSGFPVDPGASVSPDGSVPGSLSGDPGIFSDSVDFSVDFSVDLCELSF